MRVGLGHDTHRLAQGGPLRLGGIVIPWDRHLVGHSDADVLLHAVTDALLGAAALGDIGELFPDSVEENRSRASSEMLQIAWQMVRQAGWHILNLDCIVFAEQPKLGPYKRQMAQRIAQLLVIPEAQVAVKAKTGERVGPVGEGTVISAACVALLARPEGSSS